MGQHDPDHEHGSELSETQLRVRALETVLTEKGYIDPTALDAIIEAYETKVGPHVGARIVAKAWNDAAFKQALLQDASKTVSALGHESRVGDHLVAVENTPQLHNMVVCTLCSCYPWEVLGLPPVWYKSAPYRSRAIKDPRGVLADFGVKLPKDTQIRVWDSTAETRFLVLPMRPAGSEGLGEQRLAQLVTRDAMIGTGLAKRPEELTLMDGVHDMGGMDGFGTVEPEPNEPPFHAPWEGRVLAMQRAMGYAGAWHIDMSRFAQERLPPPVYLTSSYYQRWALAMERNVVERGFADPDELSAGHALRPGKPLKRKLTPDVVRQGLTRGSFYRQAQAPARFKPGDRVRAKNIHPPTHTRLPRYARGRVGVVELVHGCHAFPDTVAIDKGDNPQWLYTVVFEGTELWGPDADPSIKISIDAFEPYLEPA